tara:strand:+ start:2461 stop:2685 length:225 start_codon:yes stop_codon:yes gene_type:complete
MKESQFLLINELFESWIMMFNNIDDVVEDIVKHHPSFESKINRDVIRTSVKKTQHLARLLEKGKEKSKLSSLSK